MKHTFLLAIFLVVAPAGFAQKKEDFNQMQRDILQLDDKMRTMQRSQDEKFAALTALLQQTLEAANKALASVGALDSVSKERFQEQEKSLAIPVSNLGTKVAQISNDVSSVRESVADLGSRLGKLQNQMVDLGGIVKAASAPPAPPPSAGGAPPAGVSAQALFDAAKRDLSAGNSELAIQQFSDYLKYFPTTDNAPEALFNVGQIYYLRGDYDAALKSFDQLLEAYPDNAKTPDALYLKGRALQASGFKVEARQEFLSLIKKYPNHENAAKAQAQLRSLSAPPSKPAPHRKK